MKRLLVSLLFLAPAFAQIVRIDPTPVYTTSTIPPPGAYAPVLAVPGSTISINTTTYTDSTGSTPCPSNVQVVIAGTAGCTPTASPQGAFGFWVQASTSPYMYTITYPNGQIYGPYPVSAGGGGQGGGGGIVYGLTVQQSPTGATGGYIDLTPVTYNPYGQSGVCKDSFGNIVQQPVPIPGAPAFGPNDAVLWVGTSPELPNTPTANCPTPGGPPLNINLNLGINTNQYIFTRGGVATDYPAYNSIQSLFGGIAVALGVTMGQADYYAPQTSCTVLDKPSAASGDGGFGGYVAGSGSTYCYYNPITAVWAPVNLASSGGGGCAVSGTAGNIVYLNAGGITCTNSNSLTYTSGQLAISSASILTSGTSNGFDASTCTASNCLQAPSGGALLGLGVAVGQALYPLAATTSCTLNTPASTYGGVGYTGTGLQYCLYNQTSGMWVNVNLASAGSGCTVSGTAGSVVFLNTGGATCSNSTNLAFVSQVLAITGTSSTAQALNVTGYGIASDGWNAGTCALSTCIEAIDGGGTFGLGVTVGQALYPAAATTCSSLNTPASTYGGVGYAGTGIQYCFYNQTTSSWNTVNLASSGGGVTSLNSLTGGLTIAGTTNEIIVTPGGPTILLATPQAIATTSNVLFNDITAASQFISQGTGASVTFSNGNGSFSVNGNGTIQVSGASAGLNVLVDTYYNSIQTVGGLMGGASTNFLCGTNGLVFVASNCNFWVNSNGTMTLQGSSQAGLSVLNTAGNSIQTTGNIDACTTGACVGGSAFSVNGVPVITSARGATFAGLVNVQGGLTSTSYVEANIYDVTGGFFGQTTNIVIGGCTIYVAGGIIYAKAGGC